MSKTDQKTLKKIGKMGMESIFPEKTRISVGMATCGLATGAQEVYDALEDAIAKAGLDIVLSRTGCVGFCQIEPLVDIFIPGKPRLTYSEMTAKKAGIMIEALKDETIPEQDILCRYDKEILLDDGFKDYGVSSDEAVIDKTPEYSELPFFRKQKKIALRNCGLINPESFEEYAARGGYSALQKVLIEMTPEEVIADVMLSGLRGRGGGGFPTGVKWDFTRKAAGEDKFIVCNADEGDPGAYMDRSILEGDPHTVIEGMIIGGYAIGASMGFIYCRTEYPLAIERLNTALQQAREHGLLGKKIFGSDFSYEIEIREGSGAFVCGEETSLMHSIEGLSPEPRTKPPFPSESGLWEAPTNINNVETWANIPPIIVKGGSWYASIGTEKSKGTKVFSLVGKVNNTGLIEVPIEIDVQQLAAGIEADALPLQLLPHRLALLDPYWSPFDQDYLGGEKTSDRVRAIIEQTVLAQDIPVEWYRSSSLTDGFLISDANETLQTHVVFTEMRPRYCNQAEQVCKHQAAWQSYFLSFGSPPPPECERADAEAVCIATGRSAASANTSHERLDEMMSAPFHWIQVSDPDDIDNTLTRRTDDDWFERQPKRFLQ